MSQFTTKKLNEDAKRLFEAAKAKGFYDQYPTPEHRKEQSFIDQKLNLIVTEIAEAYESYRIGMIDAEEENLSDLWEDREELILINKFSEKYNIVVKGTVGEELADVYIRTCDLAGATDTALIYVTISKFQFPNVEKLFRELIIQTVMPFKEATDYEKTRLSHILAYTNTIADWFGIDLYKHVELKACRNREREYMHGKLF